MKKMKAISSLMALILTLPLLSSPALARSWDNPTVPDYLVSNGIVRLQPGEQVNLSSLLVHYNTDDETYGIGSRVWTSQSPQVATVDHKGLVTAVARGTSRISVRYSDNRANVVEQTVRVRVGNGLTESPDDSITVNEGGELELSPLLFPGMDAAAREQIQWSIDKTFTASISQQGRVTAKAYGTCKATGVYTNSEGVAVEKTVVIQVISKNHAVLREASLTLSPGDSVDLAQTLYAHHKGAASSISLRSDSSAVGVDGTSVIVKKAGESTVTLRYTFDGKDQYQAVKIKAL